MNEEFVVLEKPKGPIFPRNEWKKMLNPYLHSKQMLSVYGASASGKTSAIQREFEGKKGIIYIGFREKTSFLDSIKMGIKYPTTSEIAAGKIYFPEFVLLIFFLFCFFFRTWFGHRFRTS